MSTMMDQWHACKEQAGEAVVLFRLGDFYEAFHDDATLVSKEAGVTLTHRQGIPMSGVPAHASDLYIDKLLSRGHKVAVVEQIEEAKSTKGLVKREIVRIITPGTVTGGSLLVSKASSFIACLVRARSHYGLALLEITTGEFILIECADFGEALNTLSRFEPKEILIAKGEPEISKLQQQLSFTLTTKDNWYFEQEKTKNHLLKHFDVMHLDGLGLKDAEHIARAAGALLSYVGIDLRVPVHHIKKIKKQSLSGYMALDKTSQKHLELVSPLHEGSPTLLSTLDKTQTPMGTRLLKHWILHPLICSKTIHSRQKAISFFLNHTSLLSTCIEHIHPIGDIERLIMRVETGIASPRDLMALGLSLEPIPLIKQTLGSPPELAILDNLIDTSALTSHLRSALVETPPMRLHESRTFKPGYHEALDHLYSSIDNSELWLIEYQQKLRSELDIKTLKVGFTRAFGHYIEVSRAQAHKMPSHFEKRQTLVNAERFLSPELKEHAYLLAHAQERIEALEKELFQTLKELIIKQSSEIRSIAHAISTLDVLLSLAEVARVHHYVCPVIDISSDLVLEGSRHPVLERLLPPHEFMPNDLELKHSKHMLIITGPNMAGKSTFMRQAALIVIMAHMGSFVPAQKAHIGIIDKVFTRIGASDDLARGQSTFMVEMAETANILHHATSKSLVILDEIGRGTSTYDGIAIAWSVAEHLLTEIGAKTLFATHYAELTKLEEKNLGAYNYHVAVHENAEGIFFLHKVVRGSADKSYGIHVAKLAGLPSKVLESAEQLLTELTKKELHHSQEINS